METLEESDVVLEAGGGGGCHCHSAAASYGNCFHLHSISESDGGGSLSSDAYGSSYDETRASSLSEGEIAGISDKRRESFVSDCSAVVMDLEAGETKVYLAKSVKDCRICHLSLDASNQESGVPIELGCSCKDDLAAAHEQCAKAWFKIKGNKTCEICGSIARNVGDANEVELMEQLNGANAAAAAAIVPVPLSETRKFWQGHRFLNLLLAGMMFAFVNSLLLHFNVPS